MPEVLTKVPSLEILDPSQPGPFNPNYEFVPQTFAEYLGQAQLKNKLALYTQAAKFRQEPLDHLLISGPPGLGKTTISKIMAAVLEVEIKICAGPALERTGDLVAILSNLRPREILFIDEIHRLPITVEEVLYSAMEKFQVNIIVGQGTGADTVNLPLHPFTLIGATTKAGALSAPLRSRFGITERIDFYNHDELEQIVLQATNFLNLTLTPTAARLIAQAARGTPRIAKKILRRVRDFAQVHAQQTADETLVTQALAFIGIDQSGLCQTDHLILQRLLSDFNGGPVGLDTLAALIGEDREALETVYEPYLLRQGYLERTPRGRRIPLKMQAILKKQLVHQQSIF